MPAVSAILLRHSALDIWTECIFVCTDQRRNCGAAAVSAVQLHHSVMDICTVCCFVIKGQRENRCSAYIYCSTLTSSGYLHMDCMQCRQQWVEGKWRFCLQFLQYYYFTLLQIHGQIEVLLVQGRRKMAFLPEVTAVQLHHYSQLLCVLRYIGWVVMST